LTGLPPSGIIFLDSRSAAQSQPGAAAILPRAGLRVPGDLDARPSQSRGAARWGVAGGLLISLRPKQWTKNLLLFLALIFSLRLDEPDLLARTALAFVAFSALASGTYLVNDVIDADRDRQHPTKRARPIAAGSLPPGMAIAVAAVLIVGAVALAVALATAFAVTLLLYLLLTLSYSLQLKHLVILDVLAVAAGFMLRAAAGATVIGVPISPWLYVCTILGALLLALGKRRHELVLLNGDVTRTRRILREYSVPFLDQMSSVVTAATIIAYSLYTFSAENLPDNQAMMLTIPFVLYGTFRYLYLVHLKGEGGTPEELLLSDRALVATVMGWVLTSIAILYFFS
jgi:4-hydroxybenzoate polyprenyltransferase